LQSVSANQIAAGTEQREQHNATNDEWQTAVATNRKRKYGLMLTFITGIDQPNVITRFLEVVT
jgi:hypothetical protein